MAVLKRAIRTNNLGSSIHNYSCGLELPPLAFLWSLQQTAKMALFGPSTGLVNNLQTLTVLMAHFSHYIAKFDGVPSELPSGISSDGILLTLAALVERSAM